MNDLLIKRLRGQRLDGRSPVDCMMDAADEIERLCEQIRGMAHIGISTESELIALRADNDRLRGLLEEALDAWTGDGPPIELDRIRAAVSGHESGQKGLKAVAGLPKQAEGGIRTVQPTAVPFVGEFPPMSDDELTLRRLLALNYSGRHLYGDDGELQDGRLPYPIDFRRMSVAEIESRMSWRGVLALQEQQRRPADKPATPQPSAAPCRIMEYDGAFKCYTHNRQWGAISAATEPCPGWTADKPDAGTDPCQGRGCADYTET